MISPNKIKYIVKKMYSSEHDHEINSIVMGEAFLENECIVYKKGKIVSIILLPLNMDSFDPFQFQHYFTGFNNGRIEKLTILGNVDLLAEVGIKALENRKIAFLSDNEFVLSCNSISNSARKDFRRGIKRGYSVEFLSPSHFFNPEVFSIWNSFLKNKISKLRKSDYEYYKAFPLILQNNKLEVVASLCSSSIIGVAFVHHLSLTKKHLLLYLGDAGYRNVADFLLGSVVEKYSEAQIFIGPSINPGMKKFKLKWAEEIKCPLYEAVFSHGVT